MGDTISGGNCLVEEGAREKGDYRTTRAPSVISTTSHPVGYETLFEGKEHLVADLVFVHGLCGHRRDTWMKDGVCWPEELLSKEEAFSHVRILTFGYDANIVGPMGRASLNSLFNHSINLLTGLSQERRQNARDRPIIFVAHCLGGLLVKDALNQSADVKETKPHLAQVVSATRGIIFLGTPHRGSTLTSLANLVASVAQITLQGSNRNLVWDLERNSQVLDRTGDSFGRLLDRRTFTVWSFIEEMPMTGGEKVVPGESAIIGDARENRGTIHADHVGMTKFLMKDDAEYKKITYAIEMVLEDLFHRTGDHAGNPVSHPIPSPSTLFTGRREYLEKLRQHFSPCRSQQQQRKQFVLYGMGGVGKTQICLKFAEECANQFKYIFWIDAANPEAVELSFKFIAGYPEVREAGVENSMQSVLQWISWIVDPWLLVIDNADNYPEIVAKCMPRGNYGNVLITSRNPDMRRHSPEAHAEVEEIEEEDAISLLLRAAFLPADSKDLRCISRAIVKKLCCLPLAVDQAGTLIARGFCNIENYLQMYANHHCKLLDHPTFKGASDYGKAVYGTWDLSFKALLLRASSENIEEDSNGARNAIILLQIFSFLHHDSISEEIFRRAATSLDYRHDAVVSSWSEDVLDKLLQIKGGEWNPLFFKGGIENLLTYSLLRRGTNADVYSMHPLVHQWSCDRATFSEKQSWHECARRLLCRSIKWTFASADYAFRQSLIPHIKANSQCASKAGIPKRYNRDEYRRLGLVFYENGHWKEAKELQVKVMESDLRVLGAQHPDTLTTMHDIASTYRNEGRWNEAEKLLVKVTETSSRVLGAEHPDTLTAMGNLASTYRNQGRWKEAEKLEVKVMETRKRAHGAEYPSTLTAMGNLASTYWNQGRWKVAEELQVEVMETSLRILGTEHPSTLTAMGSLALTYQNQGRWKEAEELEVKVMGTSLRALGTEHPSTLTAMGNLALTYKNQGMWKEAEELEVNVMETCLRLLGTEHPDNLTTMGNLASTYRNQGRWKEAEELQVKVMETSLRVLGAEHPSTLTAMGNLALTYWNQGRWKKGEEIQVKVMETSVRVLGTKHPSTLTAMGNLALTYWNQGRWKKGEEIQVKVMEISVRVLGIEHPSTLIAMGNLALTYWNQGRWTEAEELQVEVMETCLRIFEMEHPDTLTAMGNLALTYKNQGRWKEAEELEVNVMETCLRVLGTEHPDNLTTMGNLASTYRNQGRWKEAEELQVKVMETSLRVLGAEHPSTLTAMGNLALTYWNQGRWKKGEEIQVKVMETSVRVLGIEHPSTLIAMGNLALTYWNQGRWTEAEELQVTVMGTCLRILEMEHPDTLTAMGNLALTYKNQERWKEAEELEVNVMETCLRVLGTEHPDNLTTMGNLASTYRSQRRWKEAEGLQVKAMETCLRVLGAEHPSTLTAMGNLALTYWSQERWKETEELQVKVMETSLRVLGTEHPSTLTAIDNLAATYKNQGRWREAGILEVKIIDDQKEGP